MSFRETEVGRILKEWELHELKDKVNIIMGQSPKSEFYNNNNEGIPFMQGRTTFGEKYHTIDTWCTDPKKYAKQNDVLMSVRAPVGDVNIATTDLCIGRGLASLAMKNGNNEFLYYLLKNYINVIMSKGSGTVFSSINKIGIETLKLPFPSDEEQKSIAKILSDLDNKIEVNNKINKRLEDMAQSIFKHWFVDFEFPNEEGKPYKSNGGEMVESELGMIPKGWEVDEINNIASFSQGIQVPVKKQSEECLEGYKRFLRIVDYTTNDSESPRYIEEKEERYLINKKEVAMVRYGNIGFMCRRLDGIIANNIFKVNPTDKIGYNFLYYFLKRDEIQDYIISSSVGSAMPAINHGIIGSIRIVVPSKHIVEVFEKASDSIENTICKNNEINKKLINLRDTLLPKLMSGEIRVPIDK